MRLLSKDFLLAAAVLFGTAITLPASALEFRKEKLTLENLPTHSASAQSPAQDLLVRADGNSIYLYVEQQQGAVLDVFNVTDPEHLKLVASTSIAVKGAYDFVAPVKDRELISFRDGSGSALLDLRKPKAPRLFEGFQDGATRALRSRGVGNGAASNVANSLTAPSLHIDGPIQTDASIQPGQPHNLQFVASRRHPNPLVSLNNVTRFIERPETGTIFLIADGKVTLLRSPGVELQYDEDRIIPTDPN